MNGQTNTGSSKIGKGTFFYIFLKKILFPCIS